MLDSPGNRYDANGNDQTQAGRSGVLTFLCRADLAASFFFFLNRTNMLQRQDKGGYFSNSIAMVVNPLQGDGRGLSSS